MLGGTESAATGEVGGASSASPAATKSGKGTTKGGRKSQAGDEWKAWLKDGEDESDKKIRNRCMASWRKSQAKELHKTKKGMKHFLTFIALSRKQLLC